MPRMKKESVMVAKAVDCFLQVFPRVFSYRSNKFHEWLCIVNDLLSGEVDKHYFSAMQEIYFRHYVLCVVQIMLIGKLREVAASEISCDAYIKLEGDAFCLKEFLSGESDYVSTLNASIAISVLGKSYDRIAMDFGFDEIIKSSEKIINDIDHIDFVINHIEARDVIDLPMNAYVAENPLCIIEMLIYFHHMGVFQSNKLNGVFNQGTFEHVLSLALLREFNEAVFFGSSLLLERKSKENTRKQIELGLPGKEGIKYGRDNFEIKFDGDKLRFKHYRDMAKDIIDSKMSVQVLPKTGLDISRDSFFEILDYSVRNHTPKAVCSEEGKFLRADGTLSLVCSFYLRSELEMSAAGKKSIFGSLAKKTGKVNAAARVSDEIEKLFSISVSGNAIYRSFRERGDALFDSTIDGWEDVFKNNPEIINLCEWADIQMVLGNFEY